MSGDSALRALADEVGILPAYHDIMGNERVTTDASREALLAAMGFDVSDDAAAARALAARRTARAARLVDPLVVATGGGRTRASVPVRVGEGTEGAVRWEGVATLENGERLHVDGIARARHGIALLRPPRIRETGYHELRLLVKAGGVAREGETTLVVAPLTAYTPRHAVGGRPVAGIWSNLYTVPREGDWGIGDFTTLARLAEWAGAEGAEFLGVNPLHALWNRGMDISPYSPVSRLFRNPIYLDVTAVPELAESAEARGALESEEVRRTLSEVRASPEVDYERVMAVKRRVLEPLHRAFQEHHADGRSGRGRAYAEFMDREGGALRGFATFTALAEHFADDGRPTAWQEWPEEYRTPDAAAVSAFARDHADRIAYHAWVQFELERQLGVAASAAHAAGMSIGLYQDLAVGSSGGGSDAWTYRDLFRTGASVGAPPDEHSTTGQDWGFPPVDPDRLAAQGFDYWIRLVRGAMRHAGALRIDHAMAVRRLFWIPAGRPASEGAYVRYPERELLAILALESRRARALVVAEDLGTVPEGFATLLASWGVLSSQLLYFEREEGGGFRPSSAYSRRALVTTNTHDHAPLAAFWEGRDIEVRRGLDLMEDHQAEAAHRHREHERHQLVERLREEDERAGEDVEAGYAGLAAAVHRFLARTPAPLVGLSLDDLAAETTPVNVPGVGPDRFPTWSRKMRLTLEQMHDDAGVRRALAGAAERLRAPRRAPGRASASGA